TGATNAADARANLGANNESNLTTGTVPNARLAGSYSFTGLTLSGGLSVGGNANIGGNITFDTLLRTAAGKQMLFDSNGSSANRMTLGTTGNLAVSGTVTATAFSGPISANHLTVTINTD